MKAQRALTFIEEWEVRKTLHSASVNPATGEDGIKYLHLRRLAKDKIILIAFKDAIQDWINNGMPK